ncbi:MAG: hypothetical protein Q4G50_05535 [Corynebacterium sp.]|nr:hypothetical protein [Corynebacterium sp.]MDO5669446.1 hypothetical protein [Corynebacterium sp.]
MEKLIRQLMESRGIPATEGEIEVLAERYRALQARRPASPGPEVYADE